MALMTAPMTSSEPTPPTARRPYLVAGLVGLVLAIAYAPNLASLAAQWWDEPNYRFGFLIIPLALGIAWQRRGELDPAELAPSAAGWVALAVVLGARALLYENAEEWAESATLPVAAAALVLALGGWHLLRWAAAPLVVLLF